MEVTTSAFTCIILGLVLIFPIISIFVLLLKKSSLNQPQYIQRIGSLYSKIRTNDNYALLYNGLFVLRRIFFAYTAVFMHDYPYF